MKIVEALIKSLRVGAVYNPDVQAAPACILWPDRERQWEAVIPRLQDEMQEMFILGKYCPDKRTGPGIWLRCVLAGKAYDPGLPENVVSIFYLPGISRQDLRAVENCKDELKPMAELQYRGTIWSQINAKDWTILAFLKSDQGGLGLDVAMDKDAKNAMQLALYRLLDEDIELLKGKRLDKDYFNTLLTGGDPVRDLLLWLDLGETYKEAQGENEWKAFNSVCESQLAFHPDNEGALAGIQKLADRSGAWETVWERYCEAPKRYPKIPDHIKNCAMPMDLFPNEESHGGWPQWNENQEDRLREVLTGLTKLPPHDAGKKILELEKQHGGRRKLVWAELGFSPLALALKPLSELAAKTCDPLCVGLVADLADGYVQWGWKVDDCVLKALSCVEFQKDFQSVQIAVNAVYLPWIEASARHLQQIVEKQGYPGKERNPNPLDALPDCECILFVDGLRFDVAKRLISLLTASGACVNQTPTWAALPTVTSTGKPAVSPVRNLLTGNLETVKNAEFDPKVTESGKSLSGGYQFKKLLKENGWQVLEKTDVGDPGNNAWTEFGELDHQGHDKGWKIAKSIDGLIGDIKERVESLLEAGWKTVRIVTDHGWLLIPGGLPKTDLPAVLTENKWGRCAVIKPGAQTDESLYPWYWNPNQMFALANGVSCYKKGQEYAHGGLSLQECLYLEIVVTNGHADPVMGDAVEITDVKWKGMRCNVAVDGNFKGSLLDIRLQAGSASSSVVMNVKAIKGSGIGSVVVENEDLEGKEAFIVLLNEKKQIRAQVPAKIGGEL